MHQNQPLAMQSERWFLNRAARSCRAAESAHRHDVVLGGRLVGDVEVAVAEVGGAALVDDARGRVPHHDLHQGCKTPSHACPGQPSSESSSRHDLCSNPPMYDAVGPAQGIGSHRTCAAVMAQQRQGWDSHLW